MNVENVKYEKNIVLLILFSCLMGNIHAQTWDEWFRQKKTQLTYLVQQIAAFQVYEGYVQKGYTIAKQGLNTISNLKNGEFNLHQAFFSSLSKVNPSVQHYSRIADIIALQADILKQYKRSYKNAQQSGMLSKNEIGYVYSVFTSLLNGCANNISDLISLTTDNVLQLHDDQRLQRIDSIYCDMQSKYAFAKSFSNESNTLILNRQKELNESSSLITLYNLK